MTTNQTGHGTIYIDMECGTQFGIEFTCSILRCPPCGNGWVTPQEPAHWEAEEFEPTALIFQHPDGIQTTLPAPRGSLLHTFLTGILERETTQDLTEQVEEYDYDT